MESNIIKKNYVQTADGLINADNIPKVQLDTIERKYTQALLVFCLIFIIFAVGIMLIKPKSYINKPIETSLI
jgi:hypothetical protein